MRRVNTAQVNNKNTNNLNKETSKLVDFKIQALSNISKISEIRERASIIYHSQKMNIIKDISTQDKLFKQLQLETDLNQILHTPRDQIVKSNGEKQLVKLMSPYYNSDIIEYRHYQQNLFHQIALKETMKMMQKNNQLFTEKNQEKSIQEMKDYYNTMLELINHDLYLNLALLLIEARPENITFLYNESNAIDPTETVQAINSAILLPIEQIAQTKKEAGDLYFPENKEILANKLRELAVNKKVKIIDTTIKGNADFKIPTTPLELMKYNNKNYKILLVGKDFINNVEMQQRYVKELERNEELETFVLITDSSNLYKDNYFVNNLNIFKGKLEEMHKLDQQYKLKNLDQFEMRNKKQFFDKFKALEGKIQTLEYAEEMEDQLNKIIPDSELDYIQSNFNLAIEKQLSNKSKDMKKEIVNRIVEESNNDIDF